MSDRPAPMPPPIQSDLERSALPIRFSVRTLLIGMTVFALWCALAASLPRSLTLILVGLAWVVILGWLVTGLFFARGDQRAFCIGASVVFSSMWSSVGGRLMNGIHEIAFSPFGLNIGSTVLLWSDLLVLACLAAANGWFCIQARRYFERNNPPTG